jgi:hypothetical protein
MTDRMDVAPRADARNIERYGWNGGEPGLTDGYRRGSMGRPAAGIARESPNVCCRCKEKPKGSNNYCRDCMLAYQREYYKKNKSKWPEYRKREMPRVYTKEWYQKNRERLLRGQAKYRQSGGKLLHKYGITREEQDRIILMQLGCCAICSRPEKFLVIDHCHKTGHVRGLLCHPCNRGIGQLNDDADRLFAAAEYLRRHQ